MWSIHFILLLLWQPFAAAQTPHGAEESKEMGPVAFMWPPDREWNAAQDNTSPCGSAFAPSNRTAFPTSGGAVALVVQDDSWKVQLSISYSSDPKTNSDFTLLTASSRIPDVDPGHQCYPLPSPLPDASNTNLKTSPLATLQIIYESDADETGPDTNDTYYACADITFVDVAEFQAASIPCFNVTSEEFVPADGMAGSSSASGSATRTAGSSGAVETSGSNVGAAEGKKGGGLSSGAIAGIVVGSIIGVLAILAAMVLFYRRRQKGDRAKQMEASKRAVDWKTARNESEEIELGSVRK